MTVFRNEGRWDTSNIEFSDGEIRCYDKINRTSMMHHIDYGLSVLAAGAIADWRADDVFDLADVFRDLLQKRALAVRIPMHCGQDSDASRTAFR
jgi:hypothetical protein